MDIKQLTDSIKADKTVENELDFAVSKALDYILGELDKRVVQGVQYKDVIAEIKKELGK